MNIDVNVVSQPIPVNVSLTPPTNVNAELYGTALLSNTVNALAARVTELEANTIDNTPYTTIDLSDKILGNLPASQPGGIISGDVQSQMRYTKVGSTVSGNVTIVIPGTTTWPEVDPFFPIRPVAIKASDLPFPPKSYPAIGELPPPQVGGFGLFNVNWFDEEEVPQGEGFSVGSVITDFGGLLADGGIFAFFHAGNNTSTQLANLVYDGNFVGLVGRDVVIYNRFEYEAEDEES